jgi:hypothetical protein
LSGAKDITLKKPIVICPYDRAYCTELLGAIEEAVKEGRRISASGPMAPAQFIVKAQDPNGLKLLGLCTVGGERKLLIE